MNQLLDRLPDADTNDIHDVLFEVKDYAKRIHWWIRLFGVVWLTGLAVALAFGLYVGATAGRTDKPSSSPGLSQEWWNCMARNEGVTACDQYR